MRMARAGCPREVFASDAIVLLHEATASAMPDLDRLAAAALRETTRKKRKLVERDWPRLHITKRLGVCTAFADRLMLFAI